MIEREIKTELLKTAQEFPIITIIGPRQSGKTTLAKAAFPEYAYANLENPEHRALAVSDPKSFLKTFGAPAIIDEIQNVPELLSWLQITVDQEPGNTAQYILTGPFFPFKTHL